MDTITHSLLGVVIAQLGFRQRLGRSSMLVAAAVAAAPDADMLAAPAMRALGLVTGPFDAQVLHRSLTHSVFILPLLVLIPAGLWWLVRRRQFGWIYLLCLLAALTQPVLDWLNSYGTQLFWPYHARYALDAMPVVDLIYTSVLVLTLLLVWALCAWRKRSGRVDLAAAWTGLALSFVYIAAGFAMHHLAEERARQALQSMAGPREAAVASVHAYPTMGSIFVWRLTAQTPAGWYAGRTHMLYDRPAEMHFFPQDDGPLVRQAVENPEVETFLWFTMQQTRVVRQEQDGQPVLDLYDMRYGLTAASGQSPWAAQVCFNPAGKIESVQMVRGIERYGSFASSVKESWRNLFRP